MKCVNCELEATGKSKYCPVHKQIARAKWIEMIKGAAAAKEEKLSNFEAWYKEADTAGREAAKACKPVPMIVQQHANVMDDNSDVVQQWAVPEGVCGFAWVIIRPATSSFARWLAKNDKGRKDYYGGLNVSCPLPTQSMEIKEAYCHAFSRVLTSKGIDASSRSRID